MTPKVRIAAIATAYFPVSHADVIVSRWLEPRPTDPQWGWPRHDSEPDSEIVSLHVMQTTRQDPTDPHRDISQEIASRYNVPLFDTIRDALTLGSDELAVDGVLLIGEHGDYPMSELGQKMYPRFELWSEIVGVMRDTGRYIPLFCDKHFSYENSRALQMFEEMRRLNIPFMAGSSLPMCRLEPPIELAPDVELQESLSLFYGGPEVYGFHALELTQSLIEHRSGGESGIRRVAACSGDAVWAMLEANPAQRILFDAALQTAKRIQAGSPRENCCATPPVVFCLEHADGFKATYIMLQGHLQDFIVAVRDKNNHIQAGCWDGGDKADFYGHFAAFNRDIEGLFVDGRLSSPPERTLLTTLTINTLMVALTTPGQWCDTPHLIRPYTSVKDSYPPRWPQRSLSPPLAPRSFVE